MPYRIAHISDLHFSKITWNPTQFLSKRWIGNMNLLFNRRKSFQVERLSFFSEWLKKNPVDQITVTGDLSTTGRNIEFSEAKKWLQTLQDQKMSLLLVPGNHDHYTKKGYEAKTFYQYFSNSSPQFFSLKEFGVEAAPLFHDFWYVALDTCLSTSLFSSRGLFSRKLEKKLQEVLLLLPKQAKVMLVTHYPFLCNDPVTHSLQRREHLQKILKKNPQIFLYLHGHTHRSCLADLRSQKLPILLDAGSLTYYKRSSFNLLTFHEKKLEVTGWERKEDQWIPFKEQSFSW